MRPRPPRATPARLLLLAGATAMAGAIGLAGCARETDEGRGSVDERAALVDAEGRRIVLDPAPGRIVSLVPSATETLLALGVADRLVARTDFDTTTALAHLPSVGGGLNPSIETLIDLRPDLVVRFAGETDRQTPAALDRAGIPHLAVRPERIADVSHMIRTLGRAVDRSDAAAAILSRHDRTLAGIRARVEGEAPVRVAFTLGGQPPYVAGPDTFVGELIEVAGAENVFGDLTQPWAGVTGEAFLARTPELVIMPEGASLDPRLLAGAVVRRVPAVVQLPGPGLDRAARAVARAIHPELFGDPAPPPEPPAGGPAR